MVQRFMTMPTTRRVILHISLSLGIIGLIAGGSYGLAQHADSLARTWVANLRPYIGKPITAKPEAPPSYLDLKHCLGAKEEEKALLQTQLNEIRNRAQHHLDIAIYFFSRFYMAIMAFSIAGAIAAIILAVISKRGIDQASEYLVTVFLITTALAIYYQAFPNVFQQRKNVDNNRALYVKYINLEDDIATYCVTGEVTVREPKLIVTASAPSNEGAAEGTPAGTRGGTNTNVRIESFTSPLIAKDFIHYINYQLKTYNDIAIGIDESKAARFAKEQFSIE